MKELTVLGKKLFAAKQRKAKLEKELTLVNLEIDELATKTIADIMTNAEVEKWTIKDHGTIYLKDEFYCNVLREDRPQLYTWLRKTKRGDLIVDWVFPQTLKAFAKEQAEKGKPIPEFIKVAFIPTVNTRANSK